MDIEKDKDKDKDMDMDMDTELGMDILSLRSTPLRLPPLPCSAAPQKRN